VTESPNLPAPWLPSEGEAYLSSTIDPKRTLQVIDEATPLREQVGNTLQIVDLVAHKVDVPDPKTGELIEANRIILVCDDGSAFAAISKGILGSIRRIVATYGPPSQWPEGGIAVKVNAKAAKVGQVFTLSPA